MGRKRRGQALDWEEDHFSLTSLVLQISKTSRSRHSGVFVKVGGQIALNC